MQRVKEYLGNVDFLRDLVHVLDLHLGVAERKRILAGHEQPGLLTDPARRSCWINSVVGKLETITAQEVKGRILRLVNAPGAHPGRERPTHRVK